MGEAEGGYIANGHGGSYAGESERVYSTRACMSVQPPHCRIWPPAVLLDPAECERRTAKEAERESRRDEDDDDGDRR